MLDEINNRFTHIMINLNKGKENVIKEIDELINTLRNESKKYTNEILKIDIKLFILHSFFKWFNDTYADENNIDGDMGWLFFSYSLILNNKKECYTNKNKNIECIKNFVNELYDFFMISRMIQSFKIMLENDNFNINDIKNNNIDIISLINNREKIFSKSLINHKIANIHGWHFYDFQLIDYILFLTENLPKKVLNTIGYDIMVISKLYFQNLDYIKNFINKNSNPENVLKLLLFPLHSNIEYNKYFEKNSCNLGDNNEYLLPLDNTVLSKKPFIKIEDKLYLNPFFHKIGLALGTKLLNENLLEHNLEEYVKVKSIYCEDRTFDFIKNIFKEENCFKNVFYKKDEQMFELDILLIYEPFVLCFEVKSNNITEKQQEDKEKYFKKIKKDFIKKAYEQLNNFYDELKNNDEISIYESNKKDSATVFTIKKSNCIFIPFIVTMEDFSYLSGDSKTLINLSNSNKNSIVPIIINIFELEIISEVLNKNYEFINYFLQRIVSVNNKNTFIEDGTDEINQLGFYLKNNNITSLKYINTDTKYLYLEQSCRKDIDNYFCYRLDNTKPILPSLNLDKFILDLIDFINKNENFNQCNKNIAIQFVLCLMNEFIENIKKEHKVDNFYDYIEKEKSILNENNSIIFHRVISKELLSIVSENDKDANFLLSIIIHKNNNDNGEFNKSHIYTYMNNNKNITHFLSISFCVINNKFDILFLDIKINPYEYFCSKLKKEA